MRGLLLAGGTGTRLQPLTNVISKQLLPVYDKPLIYYPLSTLMLAGIRDILVITTPRDAEMVQRLLGDGEQWGISLQYAVQPRPAGIAEALTIGSSFAASEPVALILGDNVFHGPTLGTSLARNLDPDGVHILAYEVSDPRQYAVLELDAEGDPVGLEEKPSSPRSRLAVTGLYFFAGDAPDKAAELSPSRRGELEITDLNRAYLREGRLTYEVLQRGTAWLDAGTIHSLNEASVYVRVMEERHGLKVSCPEEVAWRNGWISSDQIIALSARLSATEYGTYLRDLLNVDTL